MFIKKITQQNRRDFRAVYKCEHCGDTHEGSGYDDDNFHRNVVPNMVCKKCNKKADAASFRPLGTKYPDGMII